MPTEKEPSRILIIASFAALYLVWGSTYLAIIIGVAELPPFFFAGLRFLLAGLILLAFCRYKRQQLPNRRSLQRISISGIIMLSIGTGSVFWVEQYIPSGLSAIIVATLPLWLVLIDRRQWNFHFRNPWIIAGILIGFAGVLLLFGDKNIFHLGGDPLIIISVFVLMAGTMCWAMGSIYSKYAKVEGAPAIRAAIQMTAAGLFSLLLSGVTGEWGRLDLGNISAKSIWALVYLILIGSVITYMAYIWLLSVRPASQVGTYAYVNPVVAVFLGWFFAKEPLTWQQVIALIVILTGVILVNLAKEKK
jgi:drug/metabolite transporter (DMT)-like permease